MHPLISVIIPACNEEAFIEKAINSVRASATSANHPIEIIVVANRCTDKTEEISINLGCSVVHNDEKNLSAIRNAGAKASTGEIIVTLDADSQVSLNIFHEIEIALSKPNIIGGGTVIIPERWSFGIALTGLFLLPAVLFERVSGGLFYCRREDYWAIGGFDESVLSAEDIDFARRLKQYGRKTDRRFQTLWRSKVITSCRKFDRFGDWFFLKNPLMVLKLLKGKDRRYADLVWYDFHNKKDDSL